MVIGYFDKGKFIFLYIFVGLLFFIYSLLFYNKDVWYLFEILIIYFIYLRLYGFYCYKWYIKYFNNIIIICGLI